MKHVTSAPYHPSTNGLAERAVQVLKKGLKKVTEGTIHSHLSKILMCYRITPESTTGSSPAELLLGKQPRTRLDLLRPNLEVNVEKKQLQQKVDHDRHAKGRVFKTGTLVYARNFGSGHTWTPGHIVERSGPVSFMVKCSDGNLVRRHQDQLRYRTGTQDAVESDQSSSDVWIDVSPNVSPDTRSETVPVDTNRQSDSSQTTSNASSERKQYPRREHRPPNRY